MIYLPSMPEVALILDGSGTQIEANLRSYPLLFEMLRSFTTLADKLNLSHAVKELGSTRQTVRRHIAQLEELKGGLLFDVSERQYKLTELGRQILPEAQDLISQAEGWVTGRSQQFNGLQYLRQTLDTGWSYFQQQHPLSKVFTSSGTLVPDCLKAWAESGGEIEHEAMKAVRPMCMIFRRSDENWVFTEVGEESSFISWFGWATARSTVGRPLGQMPGGANFGRLVNAAYVELEQLHSARLDHCFTMIHNEEYGESIPVAYERLLLGSRFADGSFAMVTTVRRTYDVEIEGVTDEMLRQMPEKFLM